MLVRDADELRNIPEAVRLELIMECVRASNAKQREIVARYEAQKKTPPFGGAS